MEANPDTGMAGTIQEMCPMLMVFDMPESLRFYCDLLGFRLVQSAGPPGDMGWAMMRLGNIWLMLNTLYELPDRPVSADSLRVSAHGDTSLYFSVPDIDGMYRHLRSQGIEVKEPYNTGYGFRALDLKDPDGYTIVFHWPMEPPQGVH
jgi:glyoxylase I family protein